MIIGAAGFRPDPGPRTATPPPPKGVCNRVAILQAQEGEQKGGGHPAVSVPRSWLTSPFRVVGLVPAPPPPPRS